MNGSNMNSLKDDRIVREEFSNWLNTTSSELPEYELKANPYRKYYVYALCEKTTDGSLTPFYIGKGANDRVWSHSDETQAELAELEEEAKRYDFTKEQIQLRKDTISEKHKRIEALEKEDRLSRIIVKTGLTEYEAFMCESALINIFRLDGLSFPRAEKLTNKVNGHANPFEKYAEIETEALSVDEYYDNYCKNPILVNAMNDEQKENFDDTNIIFININKFYKKCTDRKIFPTKDEQTQAIREAVRAFWNMAPREDVKYAFAMVNGSIKGVFKVVKENDGTVSHSILDMWHDDYPKFDKLQERKMENEVAEAIYNDLISQSPRLLDEHKPADKQLKKYKNTLYSQLKDPAKKAFKNSIDDYENKYRKWKNNNQKEWDKYNNKTRKTKPSFECNEEDFLNHRLSDWLNKRFLVLTELSEDDPDYTKYINCSIRYSPEYIRQLSENNPDRKKIKSTPFDQNPVTYLKNILKDD